MTKKSDTTVKVYRVTGFEAPLRVDKPNGKHTTYKKGDKFKGSDWPMPHITIANALKHGTIEEVE